MNITYNCRLGLAQGRESKTRTPNQLFKRQALQKITTRISLVGLFLGFSIFGILIILHRHQADLNGLMSGSSGATVGGIISILVGSAFLVSAYFHWKICLASALMHGPEIIFLAARGVPSDNPETGWWAQQGSNLRPAD